jgi:hypothetical protein
LEQVGAPCIDERLARAPIRSSLAPTAGVGCCCCCCSAAEQREVEFHLPAAANYYIGVEPMGASWVLSDGTFLGNTTPSNSSPYKHW